MRIDLGIFLANKPDLARDDTFFTGGREDKFDIQSNGKQVDFFAPPPPA